MSAVQDNQLARLQHRYHLIETENRDLRLQLRLSESRSDRRGSTGENRDIRLSESRNNCWGSTGENRDLRLSERRNNRRGSTGVAE